MQAEKKETKESPTLILDTYLEALRRADKVLAEKLDVEPRSEEIWDQFRDKIKNAPTLSGVLTPNLVELFQNATDEIMESVMKGIGEIEKIKPNYSPEDLYFIGFMETTKNLFDLIADAKESATERLFKEAF